MGIKLKQYKNIATLHKEVFDFLMEMINEYPNLYFTIRKSNHEQRLERGYFFWGYNQHQKKYTNLNKIGNFV